MRGYIAFAAIAVMAGATAAQADDCSPLMNAMLSQASKPYNATLTMSDPTGHNQTSKVIFTGAVLYTQIQGQWRSMPMTGKELSDQLRDVSKTAKTTCHRGNDEAVNGQPATVYAAHVENQGSISDNKVWISKANGVPLKSDVTIQQGPHMTTVFDYSKVAPPAGATPLVPPPQH